MKIDYDGKWPNLCSGRLNVMLGGELYEFGPRAIRTGGECHYYHSTGEIDVSEGPWKWAQDLKVPAGFPKERLPELLNLINDEVSWGCCGGCL